MTLLFIISLAHWISFLLQPLPILSPCVTYLITAWFPCNYVAEYLFPWLLPSLLQCVVLRPSFVLRHSSFWWSVLGPLLRLFSWSFVIILRCDTLIFKSLNQLLSQHWSSTTRKMAQIPPLLPSFFVYMILRSIANLLGEHVEKAFQGIARMLHISNIVLDWMLRLLFDMFKDSRNVIILGERMSTPRSGRSKPECEPSSTWCSMFDPVLDQRRRTFVLEAVGMTTTTRWQSGTKSAHRYRVNNL